MSALIKFAPRLHDPESTPSGLRLKQLCGLYCGAKPQLSAEAIEQYQVGVNLARRWLLSGRKRTFVWEIFTLDRFREFARWLATPDASTGRPRAAATINGRLDTLWMLWGFAEEENHLCGADPRPLPKRKPRWKEPDKDPVAFTIDQIVQLMAAAMKAPPMRRCPWWTPDFWVTLIGAYLSTGERCEALLFTPRAALAGNVLTVPAELTKDGKENPVVITDWIIEKIERLPVIDSSPLIWPYPFGVDQLRARYTADILIPAGLPHTRAHKFHALRRSSLTQVHISDGLEAAREMARHFGSGLTLKRYISRSVVKQQTGSSPSFDVPAPSKQLKLF